MFCVRAAACPFKFCCAAVGVVCKCLYEEIRHRVRCYVLTAIFIGLLTALVWLGVVNGSVGEQIASFDIVDRAKKYAAEKAEAYVADVATKYLRDATSEQKP